MSERMNTRALDTFSIEDGIYESGYFDGYSYLALDPPPLTADEIMVYTAGWHSGKAARVSHIFQHSP